MPSFEKWVNPPKEGGDMIHSQLAIGNCFNSTAKCPYCEELHSIFRLDVIQHSSISAWIPFQCGACFRKWRVVFYAKWIEEEE